MRPDDSHEPENVWKAQDEEKQAMQIRVKPEELAALVRAREKLNTFVHWAAVIVTGSLAAGSLYNVWSVDQPWIRFGQAWMFGLLAYVLGTELDYGAGRKGVNEPSVRFLESQHEERASGYLRIRRRLWLLIPSIVASWLGGGPLNLARARGLDPSSRLFQFCAGPWPFILVGACLVLVWLAFGSAAAKARRDLEELRRSVTG
jgi:hypothetical protein